MTPHDKYWYTSLRLQNLEQFVTAINLAAETNTNLDKPFLSVTISDHLCWTPLKARREQNIQCLFPQSATCSVEEAIDNKEAP